MKVSNRSWATLIFATVAVSVAGCSSSGSSNSAPTSADNVVSQLKTAGISCPSASSSAGGTGSITTCGSTIYIAWLNDQTQDIPKYLCSVAKANGVDPKTAGSTEAVVYGTAYYIAAQHNGDWGGTTPEAVSKAVSGSSVLTGADLAKAC